MRYLAICFIVFVSFTSKLAAQNCSPIRFVSAPEVSFFKEGSKVGGLLREADGSFTAQWFQMFSPYSKTERAPRAEDPFVNSCLGWNRPSFTTPQSITIGQQLGLPSGKMVFTQLPTGQLVALGIYTRLRNLLIAGVTTSDISLASSAMYPVPASPAYVLVADFNKDGIRDAAVVSSPDTADSLGSVSVLMGAPDGTFSTARIYQAGKRSISATAGDFNRDGAVDLAVANYESGDISIFLNAGDGTFRSPVPYPTGQHPQSIAAADFNGDQLLELVTANESSSVSVLLGNGDGSFKPPLDTTVPLSPNTLAFGDLDGNGKLDIVISNPSSSTLLVLMGRGNGTFEKGPAYSVGYHPQSLLITDFNWDGFQDVVVAGGDANGLTPDRDSGTITVLLGKGDGTLHAAPHYITGQANAQVATDVTGDGLPDIVVANSDGTVSVLTGLGSGSFSAPLNTSVQVRGSGNLGSIAAGDFNRDGRTDLAVVERNSGSVVILQGTPQGTWVQQPPLTFWQNPNTVITADLNKDGRLDLVVSADGGSNTSPGGKLSVLLGRADGSFAAPMDYSVGTRPSSIAAADLDGDGSLDLVVGNGAIYGSTTTPGNIVVLLDNGDGTFRAPTPFNAGLDPKTVSVSDLNKDGVPDLVVSTQRQAFDYGIDVFLGDGRGGLGTPTFYATNFGSEGIAIADFSGDGNADLIVAHCCGLTDLTFLVGQGDGTFQSPVHFAGGADPTRLAVSDLNGDGKPDLVVLNAGSRNGGGVTVLLNVPVGGVGGLNSSTSVSIPGNGTGRTSTAAISGNVRVGYGLLQVDAGSVPYGTAVFSLTQNGTVVSEVGVPAVPPTTTARTFIDFRTAVSPIPSRTDQGTVSVNTGLALVNTNGASVSITFTLRALDGTTLAIGHGSIAANGHAARFIDQLAAIAPDFVLPANFATTRGFATLDIAGSAPLSVLALRLTVNQRGETLLTSTPVADVTKQSSQPIFFPQIADGGGYTTSVILMNTSATTQQGTVSFFTDDGSLLVVNRVGGTAAASFAYAMTSGEAFVIQTDGSGPSVRVGFARVNANSGNSIPAGAGVFGLSQGGVLVTETGVPAGTITTRARMYVDISNGHGTGVALASVGPAQTVTLQAFQSDGSTAGTSVTVDLAVNGHKSAFVDQLVTGLPAGFKGVLELTSPTNFTALTLRSLANSRGNFLLTTFPTANVNVPATVPLIFPQIAAGGGYTTEFILLGGSSSTTTTLRFYDDNDLPLPIAQ